jgi:hypothetical protein
MTRREDATVEADVAQATAEGLPLRVWISENFAQYWYADALHEARTGKDMQAKRREIVLAACFAESYIFEWARSVVGVEAINDYFPPQPRFKDDPRYRRRLKRKWRQIPTELHQDGEIRVAPVLDLSEFGTLVRFRNGLVHAAASRPMTDSLPAQAKPFPTIEQLKKLPHGWAVQMVRELVEDLHQQVGTSPPDYLARP